MARGTFSRRVRNAVLTTHIIVSVGLLGEAAGLLAIAIRAANTDDPAFAETSHELLSMLSATFGIPLTLAALVTGVALGLGTRWGVFQYPWVYTKLALVISVAVVGGLFIGRAEEELLNGTGEPYGQLIAGAVYNVSALGVAVVLSVFKPGRPRQEEAVRP